MDFWPLSPPLSEGTGTEKRNKMKVIVLCFFMLFMVPGTLLAKDPLPIAVIVHKDNALDNISKNDLARIYRGVVENWSGGKKILVVNRPFDSKIRARFYKIVLDSKPTRKFIRPGSPIPIKMRVTKSPLATTKYISRVPPAIGFVYTNQLTDEVKVLKIDGVLPGENGYGLQ